MIGTSWSHRLARLLVRPLVGTGVTPNHLTTLRLATGILACLALIPADGTWLGWAGWLWLASALLDRADGELARIGGMATPDGHRYDYLVDNVVNSAFFVTLGLGLRETPWGVAAVVLGLWSGAALFLSSYWSEELERLDGSGRKAYSGAFGFDFDDMLYLLAPIVWLGWRAPLLATACIGVTLMMLLTAWRLWRLTGRRAGAVE
ncbi:MAG TPA: CDP-alcohol phosphatidyltransferase family protein [Hyphomicrobiaceae bacterium]|nr:CDP-alcohol phosphatidyltransferase family protein [Hyphomicrobiaceae bacterium]